MMKHHDTVLEHKLCSGKLPEALLKAAGLVGSWEGNSAATECSMMDIDANSSRAKEAERKVLWPILSEMQKSYECCLARCQELQQSGNTLLMLPPLCMYLSGQLHIVEGALKQIM